jgi:hypothetical protein
MDILSPFPVLACLVVAAVILVASQGLPALKAARIKRRRHPAEKINNNHRRR